MKFRLPNGPSLAVLKPAALAALSGLLLYAPFVEPRLFITAWVALVPLLFALRGRTLWQAWLLGTLCGVTAWALVSAWMADFFTIFRGYQAPWNVLAAALYWLYAAQVFALMAVAFQWLRRHTPVSTVVLLPVVFVAVYSLFPLMFHARLAESQSAFLVAIQGVDLIGAHGMDFIIVLVNALLYRLLAGGLSMPERRYVMPAAGIVVGVWFTYGALAAAWWSDEIDDWPTQRIGIVQPDDRATINIPPPPRGYSRTHPPEMEMSRALGRDGADLVVWPESRFKGYFRQSGVRSAYARQVAAMGVPLLFHDLERETSEGGDRDYNTAAVLDADGELAGVYRKIKRVAFGEYVPVLSQIGPVRRVVAHYFGDFLREITPGTELSSVAVGDMVLVPRICYESAFPVFIARGFGADGAGRILVFQSMNNWFGETRQPFIHMRQSLLRAVENRVPMVHAINNGPSVVARPDGRIVMRTEAFVRGTFSADMPYSTSVGGSFFSRYPWLALSMIYLAFVGLALDAWRRRRRG